MDETTITPDEVDGAVESKKAEPTAATDAIEQSASVPTNGAEKAADKNTRFFTARRIAYIATFTAMSFALRFLEFPILPAVQFLQFDFSDLFVLVCGYALGPISGLICGVMKEVIYGIFFTKTAFVGELANIVVLVPFVLLPSFMYKKYKGIKSVVLWLGVACLLRVVWSFPVNLLLTFPVFLGFKWQSGMNFFLSVWYWVMLFNLIKTVILAVGVLLLYKSVSRLIALINKKFDDRKANKNKVQAS